MTAVRILALLTAAAAVAACWPTAAQTPDTTTSAAVQAVATSTALPSLQAFPDVAGYPVVDADSYFKDGSATFKFGYEFLAPDGLVCWLSAYPRREYARVGCVGANDVRGSDRWVVSAERSVPARLESPAGVALSSGKSPPLDLPPGHVLRTDTDQFCVAEADAVACKVGEHGFVLTPSSTELF